MWGVTHHSITTLCSPMESTPSQYHHSLQPSGAVELQICRFRQFCIFNSDSTNDSQTLQNKPYTFILLGWLCQNIGNRTWSLHQNPMIKSHTFNAWFAGKRKWSRMCMHWPWAVGGMCWWFGIGNGMMSWGVETEIVYLLPHWDPVHMNSYTQLVDFISTEMFKIHTINSFV